MKEGEREKAWDDRKERMMLGFLADLEDKAFIKSTNSVTGEVELFGHPIADMEATIRICGEWDREDLKAIIIARAG